MLLRLDCLMKSVRITAARHNTSGKLIDDHNLVVFYNVILVTVHQVMGTKCKDNVVLDLKVLRICKVLNIKEFLNLLHTLLSKVDNLVFLIYNEVSGLNNFLAHDSCHLGHLMAGFSTLQLLCKNIADLIQLGGLAALTGNDQRGTRLINQDGVDLIDDTVVKITLYQLLLVDNHVITKVIESKLVIGNISNVAVVCCTALFRLHIVQYNANGKTKESVNLSHLLSITLSQVIIDSYNVNALAFQRIQVGWKCGYQGLTFTSLHLSDTSLMKNDTTDQLYLEVLHSKYSLGSLTDGSKCLWQKVIQGCSFFQTFLIFSCLTAKFFVG